MPRVTAIMNPMARNGRLGRRRAGLIQELLAAFPSVSVVFTERRGHASDLAAEHGASDDDTVIAVGGDGTVNEVAAGLVRAGAVATMAIVPAGTGNDFASSLGLVPGPGVVDRVAAGSARPVDYGVATADGKSAVFMNAVGVGFDALAAYRSIGLKRLPGSMAYTLGVLRALLEWKSPPATLQYDDGEMRLDLMFMAASNGPRSGGDFLLSPDATPFDGKLDACVVRGLPLFRALTMMPRTRTGDHVNEPEVSMIRSGGFRIRTERPVPVHVDGEMLSLACSDLIVRTHAGGLRIIVPRA